MTASLMLARKADSPKTSEVHDYSAQEIGPEQGSPATKAREMPGFQALSPIVSEMR